jgi:hypothetical protein
MFTLKLKAEAQLKNLSIGGDFGPKVIVEGVLGEIKQLTDFEGTLLKIEFEEGELCLDASFKDLAQLAKASQKEEKK